MSYLSNTVAVFICSYLVADAKPTPESDWIATPKEVVVVQAPNKNA